MGQPFPNKKMPGLILEYRGNDLFTITETDYNGHTNIISLHTRQFPILRDWADDLIKEALRTGAEDMP